MSAIPLLLRRAERGLGPRIPIRYPVWTVIVEGLAPGDTVVLSIEKTGIEVQHMDFGLGETYLDDPITKGSIVRAELDGMDSCVSVWLN